MKKIAVIGIGIMGNGIASNFLKHGYQVFVWNRHENKLKDLVKKGAVVKRTPCEATRSADLVFEVTANDESSRSVWLGKDGILRGASPQKILIECSTVSIDWIDELVAACKKDHMPFFDMAMTGGRIGAEAGTLILLVGGNKQILESLKSDLKAISEKIMYFGPAGSGIRYKLLLNMLQAIHIGALGEVLNVAKTAGLDMKVVGDALAEHPGGTTTRFTWRDYQKEPNPINFSVQWITKDLTYAKKFADSLPTPFLDEVLRKYTNAMKKKLDQKDWTIINKM